MFSLSVIAVTAVRGKLKNRSDKLMLFYLACIAVELIAFEGTYQIRYVSHIYIVIIYSFELLWRKEEWCSRQKKDGVYGLSAIMIAFICLNGLPWIKLAYDLSLIHI